MTPKPSSECNCGLFYDKDGNLHHYRACPLRGYAEPTPADLEKGKNKLVDIVRQNRTLLETPEAVDVEGILAEYDELLRTFNIEKREPNAYEVEVEGAVRSWLRTKLTVLTATLASLKGVTEKKE